MGQLPKNQFPNTVWTDFTYDAADRLTSVINKKTGPITISSFTYTLDAVGNRTQMVDLSGTHTYQYDPLYRLTQATYPGPQTDTYAYDANGNRLSKNATTYTYDAADQMTAAGGVSYGYDTTGNQTSRGSDTFSYDHENRLTQAVIGGATSSSIYNGDGLRMSHTVGAQTTSYTWDVAAGLPVVLQDGTNTYVYGLDLVSGTDGAGVQTYFLYDGLGSATGLTDGSGNNPVSYAYDIFGAIRSQTGSSPNYWLFAADQRDAESSFYYLRARYYDPATGRFLGRDSFLGYPSDPETLNGYVYTLNNPVNLIDPQGLFGFKDLKKVGNGIVKTVEKTADAAAQAFGPPYNTTRLLQIADVIPLTPICGLAGRAVGGAVGGAVAGPVGAGGGQFVGAAIGTVGCNWLEEKIGQAAAAATYIQILNSNCSVGVKATATAVNSVNLGVDITRGRTKISGALSLGKFVGEVGMYVASSQLLNCGSAAGAGAALAAGISPKE